MTRRQARELAFILLFEQSFSNEAMTDVIKTAEEARDAKIGDFTRELAEGAILKSDEIDKIIYAHCEKWKEGRISRVAMSVMRLAVYEMIYVEDLDEGVSINEAVELAKKYGGDEDPSFINGILGGISRRDKVE